MHCLRTQVSSFLDSGDEVAGMLRSRAIMEMLVERCEMEKASKSDRASVAPNRACLKQGLPEAASFVQVHMMRQREVLSANCWLANSKAALSGCYMRDGGITCRFPQSQVARTSDIDQCLPRIASLRIVPSGVTRERHHLLD